MTAVALDSGEREPRTQVSQNRTPANQGEFASFFNNANKQSPKEATWVARCASPRRGAE